MTSSCSSIACGDRLVERARVADARRAAVAREREAELLERRHQAGVGEVGGDGLRARGERGLDRRRHPQPARDGVPGEQACADHDRRVRGVRARGDRRDRDRARPDRRALAVDLEGDRRVRRSATAPASTTGHRRGGRVERRRRRWCTLGGSLAGNDSADDSSTGPPAGFERLRRRRPRDRAQPVREVRTGSSRGGASAARDPGAGAARRRTARRSRGRGSGGRRSPACGRARRHRPCAFAYASTSASRSGERPVSRR